jgi:hypothetical protein
MNHWVCNGNPEMMNWGTKLLCFASVALMSMHALACAHGWLLFLCPLWQRAVCFCWRIMCSSGVKRQSQRDVCKSQYQLGEFHHLCNELKERPIKFFECCRMLPLTFDCIIQAIWQLSRLPQNNISRRKTDTGLSLTCFRFNTLFSSMMVPVWLIQRQLYS